MNRVNRYISSFLFLIALVFVAQGQTNEIIINCVSYNSALVGQLEIDASSTLEAGCSYQSFRVINTLDNTELLPAPTDLTAPLLMTVDPSKAYEIKIVGEVSCAGSGISNVESEVKAPIFIKKIRAEQWGGVTLEWNALKGVTNPVYQIETFTGGAWVNVGSTNQLAFTDDPGVCYEENRQYRVSIAGACDYGSNVRTVDIIELMDNDPPIVIDRITVVPTGVLVEWFESDSTDIDGYDVVPIYGPRPGVEAEKVRVGRVNSHLFVTNRMNTEPVGFGVLAYQDCPANPAGSPRTSFLPEEQDPYTMLAEVSLVNCNQDFLVKWTAYKGWEERLEYYTVWYSRDGGPYELAGRVEAGDALELTVSTLDTEDGDFDFKVVANRTDAQFSESNIVPVFRTAIDPPDRFAITNVSVGDENNIAIVAEASIKPDYSHFVVVKRIGNEVDSAVVDEIEMAEEITIIDQEELAEDSIIQYKILIVNECDKVVFESEWEGTMNLQGEVREQEIESYLFWKHLIKRPFDQLILQKYDPYNQRWVDLTHVLINTDDTDAAVSEFGEEIDLLINGDSLSGVKEYRIKIVDSGLLPTDDDDVIGYSNVVKIKHQSSFFMASAFVPEIEGSFGPAIRNVDVERYHFMVFNRFGQKIFESQDPRIRWNGRHRNTGKYVQEGIYIYKLISFESTGMPREKVGSVMVLRGQP